MTKLECKKAARMFASSIIWHSIERANDERLTEKESLYIEEALRHVSEKIGKRYPTFSGMERIIDHFKPPIDLIVTPKCNHERKAPGSDGAPYCKDCGEQF